MKMKKVDYLDALVIVTGLLSVLLMFWAASSGNASPCILMIMMTILSTAYACEEHDKLRRKPRNYERI
jgi:4-hydroxybenzoate polyprenyltransferase